MNRRELLKMAAIPLIPYSNGAGAGTEVAGRRFIMFYDPRHLEVRSLNSVLFPEGATVTFVPVKLRQDQKIDDVVKIYRTDEEEEKHGEPLDAKSFVGDKA
jgi:hypothetical protein